MWKFLEPIWIVRDCVGTVLGVCFIIYAINCVLVCMRPEMVMEIGFKKMEQRYEEWAAHGQPNLLCFGTVKNSPGFVCIGPKTSMCWVLKIDEMNGLSCIGISRLMDEFCVLT